VDISNSLGQSEIVTTDEVLIEVLTFYAGIGTRAQQRAIELIDNIWNNSRIYVVEQTPPTSLDRFRRDNRYWERGYSLADCISMHTMQKLGLQEVLTHDQHFKQEGFVLLF
jgi:predicted nucleic acid-binding protein